MSEPATSPRADDLWVKDYVFGPTRTRIGCTCGSTVTIEGALPETLKCVSCGGILIGV